MSTFPESPSGEPSDEMSGRSELTPATERAGEGSGQIAWPGVQLPSTEPYPPPLRPRFPNVLDLFLLAILLALGFACAAGLTAAALHFHLFGVTTAKQAFADIHYGLGFQVAWYCCTFFGCTIVFPLFWNTSLMEGVEWRPAAARLLRWRLFRAAAACFVLAIIDGIMIPGPKEAPIDQVFKQPGAAWLLFLFGITLAPFFEELGFRGFLLPALCTAWDWCGEQFRGLPPRERDADDNVRWSLPAMIVGSVVTSIPFALMHGEQTGYSLGPFILLVFVSLVLCWVRLSTRSLAASTLVHASYNLLLFATLFLGSGGFRHMDKM